MIDSAPLRAPWRNVCSPAWPDWARQWARTKGSLTKRLVHLGQGFEVEPLVRVTRRVDGKTSHALGMTPRLRMHERRVRLRVGGQPVVVARTLVRIKGTTMDWPFWRGLGKRSLGSVLFSDRRVARGSLSFARLPAKTPWVLDLLENPQSLPVCWYVRCARFSARTGSTPLWVFEVFLPVLKNL